MESWLQRNNLAYGTMLGSGCKSAMLLAKQKERNESLKTGARWESNGDAGMAVALFGTAALAGSWLEPLHRLRSSNGSDSADASGDGSGCGGGPGCCAW